MTRGKNMQRHRVIILNYKAIWTSLLTYEKAKSTFTRWLLCPNHPVTWALLCVSQNFFKLTLLRLPKPILCKAADFHSGRAGWNWTLFRLLPRKHSFNTPSGSVHSTASPFNIWEFVLFLALHTVTSTPKI
jgi:hypothetical protein